MLSGVFETLWNIESKQELNYNLVLINIYIYIYL